MNIDRETAPKNEHLDATSRRRLLGAAAGGFALAASGLLLPDWLSEEAAARPDGAYGGQLGGRHGKDHRGRDKAKRRGRGDRKDKSRERDRPGSGGFRNTALTVRNAGLDFPNPGPYGLERFTVWFYYQTKIGFDDYGHPIKVLGPIVLDENQEVTRSYRFAPDHFRCGALIQHHAFNNGDLYVDVRNHVVLNPRGRLLQGKDLDPPANKLGSEIIAEQGFAARESKQVIVQAGASDEPAGFVYVDLIRNEDTNGFIEFILKVY
jgi:hypothetical protein